MVKQVLLFILLFCLWCTPGPMNAETTNSVALNCPVINSVAATPGACSGSTYSLTVAVDFAGGSTMVIEVGGAIQYNGAAASPIVINSLTGDGTSNVLVDVTISETGCTPAVSSTTYNAPTCGGGGCQTNRTLSGTETGTVTYLASSTITSTQTINAGANVTYGANTSVTLQTGFWAKSGSTFTASTNGCASVINNPDALQNGITTTQLKAKQLDFQVAPNPLKDVATVSFELPETGQIWISIFSGDGKLAATLLNGATRDKGFYREDFDLSKLPAGSYFISVRTATDNLAKQLVITE